MPDVSDARIIGELDRLLSVITREKIISPTVDETAMHVAYSAKLRSTCLSRQVGAALVDIEGNVVAIGTNEVPMAGGGVYGESPSPLGIENRCAFCDNKGEGAFCSNNKNQNEIIQEVIETLLGKDEAEGEKFKKHLVALRKTSLGGILEFSRSVHAEMDAIMSAARSGASPIGTRLFVTTFPCHYCARHIVGAGVYEVQYIEPYPKSRALKLHGDAIETIPENWTPPKNYTRDLWNTQKVTTNKETETTGGKVDLSEFDFTVGESAPENGKVLFRPFVGIAPRLYADVFVKDREYKDKVTGKHVIQDAEWGHTWSLYQVSYDRLEAEIGSTAEIEGAPHA